MSTAPEQPQRKVVPREPTAEMLLAAGYTGPYDIHAIWRAMWAAAPDGYGDGGGYPRADIKWAGAAPDQPAVADAATREGAEPQTVIGHNTVKIAVAKSAAADPSQEPREGCPNEALGYACACGGPPCKFPIADLPIKPRADVAVYPTLSLYDVERRVSIIEKRLTDPATCPRCQQPWTPDHECSSPPADITERLTEWTKIASYSDRDANWKRTAADAAAEIAYLRGALQRMGENVVQVDKDFKKTLDYVKELEQKLGVCPRVGSPPEPPQEPIYSVPASSIPQEPRADVAEVLANLEHMAHDAEMNKKSLLLSDAERLRQAAAAIREQAERINNLLAHAGAVADTRLDNAEHRAERAEAELAAVRARLAEAEALLLEISLQAKDLQRLKAENKPAPIQWFAAWLDEKCDAFLARSQGKGEG